MIENTLIDYPVTSKYFNEQLFTYVGSTNNCLLTSQLVWSALVTGVSDSGGVRRGEPRVDIIFISD